MVIRSVEKKQGQWDREWWMWLDLNFKQSDQNSLTEMVTTGGGEGDACTSHRKVFKGRKC